MVDNNRFYSKVEFDPLTFCWNWKGVINSYGYGVFYYVGFQEKAHRFSYEYHVKKIGKGMQLDHLCRNRKCVNPEHLEEITLKENLNRSPIHNSNKTHCPLGHPYSGKNLYIDYEGYRRFRKCISNTR